MGIPPVQDSHIWLRDSMWRPDGPRTSAIIKAPVRAYGAVGGAVGSPGQSTNGGAAGRRQGCLH